jgi:hypothetical protein
VRSQLPSAAPIDVDQGPHAQPVSSSNTTDFTRAYWMDRQGLPHTKKLRTLERFTCADAATIKYELMVDDPGAYTANGGR